MMLRQVKYFFVVILVESFTEAAEECFISQSAISQRIKALKSDLEQKAFDRRFSL